MTKKKEVKKVEPKKKVTSKPVTKVTKVAKEPKAKTTKPGTPLKGKKMHTKVEANCEVIKSGGHQMEKTVKALPKDVPEPSSVLQTCDSCHKQFEAEALAICHVPGRMAGRICNNCRRTKHYHIVDPNHPEFMI